MEPLQNLDDEDNTPASSQPVTQDSLSPENIVKDH
jgi:hypothetical protein